jgi:hypothetical protein
MAADQTGLTGDETLRKAREFNDYTFLYVRRNGAGYWVRDAKFIDDCPDLEGATVQFGADAYNADVAVCGVLRGHVRTVDDFEYAAGPSLLDPTYQRRLDTYNANLDDRHQFTVVCSWDTGDGRKRYTKRVRAANPEHAELLLLDELTEGEVLIAGVVNGWPPFEDRDLTWATISGDPDDAGQPDDADDPNDFVRQKSAVLLAWALLVTAVALGVAAAFLLL